MRKLLVLFFVFFMAHSVVGQRHDAIITNPESGRWEIVQSKLVRSLTFKLDKYTGDVYLFEESAADTSTVWLRIPRALTEEDVVDDEKTINYQLYLGGQAVRDCFLINLNNGLVWFFNTNKEHEYVFDLLK